MALVGLLLVYWPLLTVPVPFRNVDPLADLHSGGRIIDLVFETGVGPESSAGQGGSLGAAAEEAPSRYLRSMIDVAFLFVGSTYPTCGTILYGTLNDTHNLLWTGIGISATETDAVRGKQGRIVQNAFLADSVEQFSSRVENAAKPFFGAGTKWAYPQEAAANVGRRATTVKMRDAYLAMERFDLILIRGTLAASQISGHVWSRGAQARGAGWVLAVGVIGLSLAAIILYAPSAPVQRCQLRAAREFSALSFVLWLNQRNGTKPKEGA